MNPRVEAGKNFIEHHGVKGQKWGVRRAAKKAAKAEKKAWKQKSLSSETSSKVFNEAAASMNKVLPKINADPAFADMATNRHTRQQYDAVVATIFNQHLAQASLNNTTNAAGDRAWIYQMTPNGQYMHATQHKRVEHVDALPPRFELHRDPDGYVTEVSVVETEMQQSVRVGEEFLEHHGIKGMKWGQRRSKKQLERAAKQSGDHTSVRALKGKKSSELSNQELKAINERLNLEQNFHRLNPTTVQRGHNAVKGVLAIAGTGAAVYSMSQSPAGKAAIAAGRKALSK